MGKKQAEFSLDYKNRIKQALIAGGLYKLARRGLGKGLIGLALPALALLIEDLSNPKGMIVPFLRWLLSRHGKVKIIEMSPRPLQQHQPGSQSEGEKHARGRTARE